MRWFFTWLSSLRRATQPRTTPRRPRVRPGIEAHARNLLNGGSDVTVERAVSGGQIPSNGIGVNGLPAPVLTSVTAVPNGAGITGKLNSRPNTPYRIEVFGAALAGPGGSGMGTVFLGFVTVQTDAHGNASFRFTPLIPNRIPMGLLFTATATDPGGDTSAFARPAGVGFVLPPSAHRHTRAG
jgi:hypothetical protein